jgi:NAD binding domain of 6-phosphogluconate dehydrogenase
MRVGFIGLGSQGTPMARRIIDAGHPTTLWACRPASLEPFAGTAAKVAATPAELAAASDLVCICVVDAAVSGGGTADSFALGRVASAGGTLDRIAAHAGAVLQKDIRLIAGLAEAADVPTGIVVTAADAAIAAMKHPR